MIEALPSLQDKVAALLRPAAYPGSPATVEAIESHMSWVFLTPEYAFKLKKPVRSDGLDFRTLATRRFFCLEELRLNRRLAPWVYLDAVPLGQAPDGTLGVGAAGLVVDWLVMMRRLPAALMLDHLLAHGQAHADHLRQVAAQLAAFYRSLPPALADAQRYRDRLGHEVDEHEARLCDRGLAFAVPQVRPLCTRLRSFLREHGDLLAARVRAGRIVEGHGDLRPEHIWLGTPPAIIDCLEFSRELRTVDSVDELAFLALECERLGAAELGVVALRRYVELTGDACDPALVEFYQALRGCVRAGLALWHLKEPRYRGSTAWVERARMYVQLAATHAARW